MNKSTITFATNCWQNDWELVLKNGVLEKMIDNCNYPFDEKILCISNVDDLELVKSFAQVKVDQGIIDKYYVVEEYAAEVLRSLGKTKEEFGVGYHYSMSPMIAVYYGTSDFLLYFTEDACIEHSDHAWVSRAMNLLKGNESYFVANPLWNYDHEGARRESVSEMDDWYIGYGFSDQCFLVRRQDFAQDIYGETHADEKRYPEYAGASFERRVNSYMRNHSLYRVTYKTLSYLHEYSPNPKKSWFKKLFK